jgi:hypothetical protein
MLLQDSLTLIVTVREDNYLHYINLETWKVQSSSSFSYSVRPCLGH